MASNDTLYKQTWYKTEIDGLLYDYMAPGEFNALSDTEYDRVYALTEEMLTDAGDEVRCAVATTACAEQE